MARLLRQVQSLKEEFQEEQWAEAKDGDYGVEFLDEDEDGLVLLA